MSVCCARPDMHSAILQYDFFDNISTAVVQRNEIICKKIPLSNIIRVIIMSVVKISAEIKLL